MSAYRKIRQKTRKTGRRPQQDAAARESLTEFDVELTAFLDAAEVAEQRAAILAQLTEALGDAVLAERVLKRFRRLGARYLEKGTR